MRRCPPSSRGRRSSKTRCSGTFASVGRTWRNWWPVESAGKAARQRDSFDADCEGVVAWPLTSFSVQPELAVDGTDFGGPDQPRVRNRHGMQRSLERLYPEGKKAIEDREPRAEIVVLPHEGLQQRRMVGKAIQNLCRCQTIAFELASKIFRRSRSSRPSSSRRPRSTKSSRWTRQWRPASSRRARTSPPAARSLCTRDR